MTNDVYEDVKPKKIKTVIAEDGTEQVCETTALPLGRPPAALKAHRRKEPHARC